MPSFAVSKLSPGRDVGAYTSRTIAMRSQRIAAGRSTNMRKLAWIVTLAALAATPAALCGPAAAETAIPDMRGTWKGDSHSIVLGGGAHHPDGKAGEPRFTSVPFTLVIDKQDGRRFSGTFSSAQHSETVIAVVSRAGMIFMADDDGYNAGTMLASDRMEICYLHSSAARRIASCTELTRQKP